MPRGVLAIAALLCVAGGGIVLALGGPQGSAGGAPATSTVEAAPGGAGEVAAAPYLEPAERLRFLPGWEPYIYESLGRRDPFDPLLSTGEGERRITDLPDPRALELVGVLWGEDDRFALMEDASGRSFVLRQGDPVWHGHVVRIEPHSVTIRYNHFGMWKTINRPLRTGKEAIHVGER